MKLTHTCSKCGAEYESEGVPFQGETCSKHTFPEFHGFRKIARLSRDIVVTEKLDGSNGLVYIDEEGNIFAGSRNRWLWGSIQDEIHNDNHGFAHWVRDNKEELLKLGKGYHYGEFWGKGIQRGYNLQEKRFSLFNVSRWAQDIARPICCHVVPILYQGIFDTQIIEGQLNILKYYGSKASPGYMNPEGLIVYHIASGTYFKKTISNDEGKQQGGNNDGQ